MDCIIIIQRAKKNEYLFHFYKCRFCGDRVLCSDGYGVVAFATAFVAYFSILTDYRFNLSATREVSFIEKNDISFRNLTEYK